MNLGMVTSYIIAGLLLLGIAMMNISVQTSSTELAISQITRSHMASVTDLINEDFPNMGYDVNQTTLDTQGAILICKLPYRISFYRNIYDNPDSTAKKIEWRFLKDDPIPGARNEDHRELVRTVSDPDTGEIIDKSEIRLGITRFELRYFDEVGKPKSESLTSGGGCSDITNVKQVHVELEVQSHEKIYHRASSDGRYIRSVWDKRFTPPNLNL